MELPPPFDRSEVAMRSDLRELEARLGERIENSIGEAITSQTRRFLGSVAMLALTNLGTNIALIAAVR